LVFVIPGAEARAWPVGARRASKILLVQFDAFLPTRTTSRRGSRDKHFAKLADTQRDGTWAFADLVKLLGWAGFNEIGGKGSHRVFSHPSYPSHVTLAAHGNAIKPVYVRSVREAIDALSALYAKETPKP
jgi:predicted RNA binding protein YcfA (HicA-like mRNA interferase family)